VILRDLGREVPVAVAVCRQHWFRRSSSTLSDFLFRTSCGGPGAVRHFASILSPHGRADPSLLISASSVLVSRLLTASYSITTATDTELLRVIMAAVEGAFFILSHSSYTQLTTPNRVSVPISLPLPLPFVFVFSMRVCIPPPHPLSPAACLLNAA
jgi:hypothetical protein